MDGRNNAASSTPGGGGATPTAAASGIQSNGDVRAFKDAATPITSGSCPDGEALSSSERDGGGGVDLPPELPLTPQSNNKGGGGGGGGVPLEVDEEVVTALHEALALGDDEGAESIPPPPSPAQMELKQLSKERAESKDFARNMSALSVSTGGGSAATGEGIARASLSYDEEGMELPDTPKSSLVSGRKRLEDGGSSIGTDTTATNNQEAAPSKTVDWLPQQRNDKVKGDGSLSGATSHAVKTGDDVTITSFTTMTTVGDMGNPPAVPPPPLLVVDEANGGDAVLSPCLSPTPVSSNGTASGVGIGNLGAAPLMPAAHGRAKVRPARGSLRGSGVPARSPRPPRHMRAVDWCPPSSSSASSLGVASGAGSSRMASSAAGSGVVASDKTAVTSRAVRLGDDATVTTFATMTTMGDAGSILEADTEDEASSSDGEAAGGGSSDRELEGGEDGGSGRENEEEESMEDVEDEDGVVDKIPHSKRWRGTSSLSGVTNQAVRASDDQSAVTFATMTTVGGADRGSAHVVDKVPSFAPRTDASIVTNETVRMGDNQSLATWATANTMGGQLTGNVVDHVPSDADDEDTVGTSNAIREDPSLTTFTTSATSGVTAINEVVDKIPTFAGGGGGTGRSVASGVTGQAVRAGNAFPVAAADDRSVASFSTMNTMGDLGSIYETEVLDDGGNVGVNERQGLYPTSYCELDRAVVDVIPEATSSVASGTTNHSVRTGDDSASVTTFGTMGTLTTAGGGRGEQGNGEGGEGGNTVDRNERGNDVVDHVPTYPNAPSRASSVVSGTTNRAVRLNDDQSVATWATVTTSGVGLGGHANEHVVDKTPREDSSIVSDTETNLAQKDEEDQSVVTWNTMTTAGVTGGGSSGRPVARSPPPPASLSAAYAVDRVPSFSNNYKGATSLSGATGNLAVRAADDQSVVTFATMTTVGGMDRGGSQQHVVDKVPSFAPRPSNTSIVTNDTVQMGDNQSLATWATTNTNLQLTGNVVDHVPSGAADEDTVGTSNAIREDPSVTTFATSATMPRNRGISEVVDRIPTFAGEGTGRSVASGVTNQAIRRVDDRSVASFATMTTAGDPGGVYASENNRDDHVRRYSGNGDVVDHVPSDADDEDTVGTSNAIREDPSVTTFTTSATSGNRGINEVVDRIPTFAGGGGTGRSVASGATNQAVRMGDDRSVASFATMTTAGDPGSVYASENNPDGFGRLENVGRRPSSGSDGDLFDRIPPSAGGGGSARSSVVSVRTEDAVRLGDDLTVNTFATNMTDNAANEDRGVTLDQSASGPARFVMAPPTTGILRESRRSRPSSVLRDGPNREYRTSNSDSAAAAGMTESAADLPISVGESVSNTHILRAISDLRFHVDYRMGEMRELNRRDSERVLHIVQQEQAKRTALESRLHAQLLLQSEAMVAMELKLLRLEAKAVHRDSRLQRRPPNVLGASGTVNAPVAAAIADRLPPIAATPSTPNHSDEEVDSFEELELTPRGANRHYDRGHHAAGGGGIVGGSSGLFVTHGGTMHRGGVGPHGGPANIAVVTRSGASVASAVTATSFQEGEFSHAMNEDERSDDGDIEDEGDHNDDGSASTPTQSSRNRISNLESILLNPIQSQQHAGGGNDQGISTRAVRGDADGMSSLPTSVTSATMASTVVTSTTRGGESLAPPTARRASSGGAVEGDEEEELAGILRARDRHVGDHLRSNSEEFDLSGEGGDGVGEDDDEVRVGRRRTPTEPVGRAPRSRSQSPLTVQSAATGTQSVASASLGPSILSTAAVASARSFGTRRANAAAANAEAMMSGRDRSMANRVVSFTTNDLALASAQSSMIAVGGQVPSQMQENDGGGDSITMPDELDNFSDVADAFSNSARAWREEYEARLDAIHKRLGN